LPAFLSGEIALKIGRVKLRLAQGFGQLVSFLRELLEGGVGIAHNIADVWWPPKVRRYHLQLLPQGEEIGWGHRHSTPVPLHVRHSSGAVLFAIVAPL
jgi:hypothetical protein